MIILAKDLNKNGNTREEIVNVFCENLMDKIVEENKKGVRKICFDAHVWYNEKTGEISSTFRKDWVDDGISPYKYLFVDYADDIRQKFLESGYTIKPTGYIGGVWQRTEDIMW